MDPSGFFALFPGWRVVAPSTTFDYVGLFNAALRYDDPVLIVEYGLLYGEKGPQLPARGHGLLYPLWQGQGSRAARQGRDRADLCRRCRALPEGGRSAVSRGIDAEVIDLRTVDYQGMDYDAIVSSVGKPVLPSPWSLRSAALSLGAGIADEITLRCLDYLDGSRTSPSRTRRWSSPGCWAGHAALRRCGDGGHPAGGRREI